MFLMLMTDGANATLASASGWLVALAQSIAPVAVAALWQGAAIALVLGVCFWMTPRLHINIGAARRFAVWAAAFAAVVGLQFLPWFAQGRAAAIAVNALPGASAPTSWFRLDSRWALAIAALWLVASLMRAADLVLHSLQLRRLWNSATPIEIEAHLRVLLAAVSPTRRPVELCTTGKLDRPSVIGFLAPRILIPDWLFERLTPGELEQVVLHEAEHLRRRDDWTNLFQKLALVLFPLNPALIWIEGRLCREREMACDEGVVHRTQAPHAYAECLTNLAERGLQRRRAHALSLGAFGRRPELVRRVYSILARKQVLHPMAARALVGVAGCSLLIAAVELARCPQVVAFVPAAKTAKMQTQLARAVSSFRVVETKAVLPAGHEIAASTPVAAHRTVAKLTEPTDAPQSQVAFVDHAAPREVMTRAEMPDVGSDPAGQPEYVELTTWEEVRTSHCHHRLTSDYGTDANAQRQSAEATDPAGRRTVTRITVTRLIIAVYPMSSAPGSTPAHAEDDDRLPAPQPESSWLVFKL
jgi:beta-lactamase regulating signal transducer with metallopeptidase domain